MAEVRTHFDLHYDGRVLHWKGNGTFKATSGLLGHQDPAQQCIGDAGPIPEGSYYLLLHEDTDRAAANMEQCRLFAASYLQSIPRGQEAGDCEAVWANWGTNRIRLLPADPETLRACKPRRNGFYLHDSTKGFSHGCIEIEGRFFSALRARIQSDRRARSAHPDARLYLLVKYLPGRITNGGTGQP
jgi:hypothetical protein